MALVKLTLTQRFAVDSLIGQQKGNAQTMGLLYDISKKIRVGDDERKEFVKILPNNAGGLIDKNAPELGVEFEKAEYKKILELLTVTDTFSPVDMEWIQPLQKQLESLT